MGPDGYDSYAWAEVDINAAGGARNDVRQSPTIPLHSRLDWSELEWSEEGVKVRGHSYRLVGVRFVANARTSAASSTSSVAASFVSSSLSTTDANGKAASSCSPVVAAQGRAHQSSVGPLDAILGPAAGSP